MKSFRCTLFLLQTPLSSFSSCYLPPSHVVLLILILIMLFSSFSFIRVTYDRLNEMADLIAVKLRKLGAGVDKVTPYTHAYIDECLA